MDAVHPETVVRYRDEHYPSPLDVQTQLGTVRLSSGPHLTSVFSRLAHSNAHQVLFNSIVIPWQMAFRVQQGCQHVTEDTDNACIGHNERVLI